MNNVLRFRLNRTRHTCGCLGPTRASQCSANSCSARAAGVSARGRRYDVTTGTSSQSSWMPARTNRMLVPRYNIITRTVGLEHRDAFSGFEPMLYATIQSNRLLVLHIGVRFRASSQCSLPRLSTGASTPRPL